MPVAIVTPPAIEPVTLGEALEHLRLPECDAAERASLMRLIGAARRHVEMFTRRALIERTLDLKLDGFPAVIEPPQPPLISVESIKYVDTGGDEQTLDEAKYTVDTTSDPGRITPAHSESWPSTLGHVNDVTLRYKAGYGAKRSDVPEQARQAMLLMIGDWYSNRESVVVGTITSEVPNTAKALMAGITILEAV